jgi:hypothetical protein
MLERWPLLLTRASVRHPRRTVAFFLAAVALAAPGLLRLELRTDGHALVPPDDPVVRVDAEVREHFGLRDPIVVLVETSHPAGIFNRETLVRIQTLSDALAKLDGVGPRQVVSLATEHRDRVYPGTLDFRPFLDPMPDSPELMETLRSDLAAAAITRGTLVSYDRRAAAILVGTPPGRTVDRIALYREVRTLAARSAGSAGGRDRIDVVGAPVAEALLGQHILEDLALLLPLSLAVIALAVWIGCRRLWGVALTFADVGASLILTFGLMGWLGVPVHLTTAMLPVILTTISLADEVHIFWHYQRTLARPEPGETHPAPVERTLRRLIRPIVFTCLTTAAGFLSFLSSPIEPVRSFGLFAGIGVLISLLWGLCLTPAALTLLGPEKLRRPVPASGRSGNWARPFLPLLARPGWTLAALAALTVVLGAGVARLVVQDSWVDGFAPGSPFRRATDRANGHLHGTHILLAHLRWGPPTDAQRREWKSAEPLLSPQVLNAVGGLEEFLRSQPRVGGVLGPHAELTATTYLWLGRVEEARAVPERASRVRTAWERFDMGRGVDRRRAVVDDAFRRGVVTIFLKDANYRDTAALMEDVRDYAARHLAPLGAQLDFAGDVAVSQAMIPAIVRTQVSSVLLALAGSFVAVLLALRSPRTAVLAIVPVSLAVLWVFGVMGWAGIPLGVATSMFCAIALGIGVDYAIHLLEGLRSLGEGASIREAVEEEGPAILIDALAIAFGFGLLAVSQVPANARLGGLVALTLAASCVLTLGGLGALLALAEKRRRPPGKHGAAA